ncbi:MAG: hypothetical protein JST54_31350, partial [Deltaproteobacteria bacterium]|nr:hypothetical protein [Deltaproteobacteria bacterium]
PRPASCAVDSSSHLERGGSGARDLFERLDRDGTFDQSFASPLGSLVDVTNTVLLPNRIVMHYGTMFEARNLDGSIDSNFGTAGIATFPTITNGLALSPAGNLVSTLYGPDGGFFGVRAISSTGQFLRDSPPQGGVAIKSAGVVAPLAGLAGADGVVELGLLDLAGHVGLGVGSATVGTLAVSTVDAGALSQPLNIGVDGLGRVVASANATSGTILIRMTPAGLMDSSFGQMGVASIPLGTLYGGSALAITQDGYSIVGLGPSHGEPIFGLMRATPAGQLDSTFGDGGVVVVSDPVGQSIIIFVCATDFDGRILVGGQSGSSPVLMRFWP